MRLGSVAAIILGCSRLEWVGYHKRVWCEGVLIRIKHDRLLKAAVLNLLGLTYHMVNFVVVCGPPLKIVSTSALWLIPINVYKIIIHWHIICFMLPSGCFLVIENEKKLKIAKTFYLHIFILK